MGNDREHVSAEATPPDIVIITYNSSRFIEPCLRSVGEEGRPIVVDNQSTDDTVARVRESFPDVKVIVSEENRGYAAAVNTGVGAAESDIVLAVNADIEFEPTAITTLTRYLRAHPGVAVAGPQLVFPDGSWQRSFDRVPGLAEVVENLLGVAGLRRALRRLVWPFSLDRKPREVGYVDGAVHALRRQAFLDIGGFSESFFFYGEEADFCERARRAGWGVRFVPDAVVRHHRGGHRSREEKALETFVERSVAARVELHRRYSPRWRVGLQLWLELIHARKMRWFHELVGRVRPEEGSSKAATFRIRESALARARSERASR